MFRSAFITAILLVACARPAEQTTAPVTRPKLIVISIDGFRWDYLDRPSAARLRAIAATGVRAERLVPAFPTKTFPNHYTIATGLYPEHHGIVANSMVDSAIGRRFVSSDSAAVGDPRWWGGEPIWVTAIRQGHRAATMFWPGSEAPIGGIRPTYWHRFDPRVPNEERFRQLLAWIDLPRDSAPELLTLYLNELDFVAHRAGPNSAPVDSALARIDHLIGGLVDSLAARGLTNQVNLILLSDHGMTDTPPSQMIYLDDFIDLALVEIPDMNPVAAIDPRPGKEALVYAKLRGAHPRLAVFRKSEIPTRFRFRAHPRITPIVAIADEGWTITTHSRRPATDLGNHGYDPELLSMGALLIATGPAFRHGTTVPPFQSVHLYELMANVLGVTPAPNDGALDSIRSLLRRAPAPRKKAPHLQ